MQMFISRHGVGGGWGWTCNDIMQYKPLFQANNPRLYVGK